MSTNQINLKSKRFSRNSFLKYLGRIENRSDRCKHDDGIWGCILIVSIESNILHLRSTWIRSGLLSVGYLQNKRCKPVSFKWQQKNKNCWFKNLQVQIFLNWVMVSWVYFAYLIEILRFSVRFFLLLLSIFTSVFDVCQWHNVTINCFPENHATLHSITNPTNPTKRTKSSKYENCVKYQIESCSIYFTISQRHRFSDLANLEQIPLISVRGCSINHEMNHLSSVSHAIDCSIIRLIVITWLIQ